MTVGGYCGMGNLHNPQLIHRHRPPRKEGRKVSGPLGPQMEATPRKFGQTTLTNARAIGRRRGKMPPVLPVVRSGGGCPIESCVRARARPASIAALKARRVHPSIRPKPFWSTGLVIAVRTLRLRRITELIGCSGPSQQCDSSSTPV